MTAERRATLPPISEKEFAAQVIAFAKLRRWKVYFTWNSVHSPAGFPDLVLARLSDRRLLFRELKTDKGKLTEDQVEWLSMLNDLCYDWSVWRPAMWARIEDELR